MHKVMKMGLVVVLVSALAVALALTGCARSNTSPGDAEEGFNVGNLAPNFGLQSTSGQSVRLSQFRGRPVLLNFWATWCPPCRAEMPLVQKVFENQALADRGLAIMGIDLGEDPETVKGFLKSNGLSFPVLLDTQQIVAGEYNIRSIPTTFFVNKDGIIRDVRIGAFASESQIIMGLNKILG